MSQFLGYVLQILPALARGALCSLQIFALTLVIAIPLGLPIALARISKYAPLRFVSNIYIWLFRGTPLILQLFFFYFFLPRVGITLDRLPTAIVTFALNYAAYFAEIYRGGIQSIDKGQYEAAKSLGVSPVKTMINIILPQTFSRVMPPVANEAITLVKDTALVSVIAVPELLKAARDAANRDVDATAFLVAAVIYLAVTFVLTIIAKRCENYFSRYL